MFITKKRHEAETEHLREEIGRLRGARMMDAETIRQQSAAIEGLQRNYKRRGELLTDARAQREQAEAEAKSLRPDAEKFRAKAKADAERKKARRAAAKKGAAAR